LLPSRYSLDNYCLGKYIIDICPNTDPNPIHSPESTTVARIAPPADFYDAQAYCAEESVGYLMKRIMLSIVYQADKRLDLHGLTSAQWGPLMRLQTSGGSTVAELARWLQVDAGAMTRLLDRLEKKGLCKRVRSTEDRRVVKVELTPDGEAAIKQVPAVLAEVMNAHLAGFSKSEWIALKTYLQRMLETGDALREAVGSDRSP
jgi:DNA-binding MarR family transcriptional regulator